METNVIDHSTESALAGKMAFPEVVRRLTGVGVERYTADLVRMEKVFYFKTGETYIVRLPVAGRPALPTDFDQPGVAAAVSSIQRGEIDYSEFLRRIVSAGCGEYSVFIDGRHADYRGRKGEVHVERFPDAKR